MWSLLLKKIWNSEDNSLYLRDSHRFAATGYMTYWMAVDRTIKFWDTALNHSLTLKNREEDNDVPDRKNTSHNSWTSRN